MIFVNKIVILISFFAFEGGDNLFHRYFDLKFGLEALFGCLVDVI